MKKFYIVATIGLMYLGISQGAMALPLLPLIPGDGPLYFKFNNYEQISPTGSILTPSEALEQNWGIVDMTTVAAGNLSNVPSGSLPDGQLFEKGTTYWSDSPGTGEITGIFYGITNDATNVGNVIASTNGFMDLYFDPANNFSSTFVAANRTADNMYTGATEGTLLARIAFLNGAISPGNPNTSIIGTVIPTPTGFSGLADSFGVIADVDGDGFITAADGAWAQILNTKWFDTLLGPNTADLRFKNSYNPNAGWSGIAQDETQIFGATSDDPARAFAQPIPEPASMLLLGTGLAGLAGASRRRRKKNQA